ncbi:hypothetical protein HOD08_00040 [bacterium]|nr:hypothetical protein [bacterium]
MKISCGPTFLWLSILLSTVIFGSARPEGIIETQTEESLISQTKSLESTIKKSEITTTIKALEDEEAANQKSEEVKLKADTKELPEWTIMLYIQAKNNLSFYAARNLNEIASIGSNEKVNIVVQWEQPNQKGVSRYHIKKNNIARVFHDEKPLKNDQGTKIVEFAKWTKENYSAKNFSLILWNHGVGILDPIWGNTVRYPLYVPGMRGCARAEICGLTALYAEQQEIPAIRGILFDEENRVYMTNKELDETLSIVTKDVLKKPIDVLGMDACFMGMLEVNYLVRPYAKYCVGSEELVIAYGLNYVELMKKLTKETLTPKELAQAIVTTYKEFYEDKTEFYTLSAIDLSKIDAVKESVDGVVTEVKNLCETDESRIKNAMQNARVNSLEFSMPLYIDLCSFYKNFLQQLSIDPTKFTPPPESKVPRARQRHLRSRDIEAKGIEDDEKFRILSQKISVSLSAVDSAVIANTGSKTFRDAKGLSVYFPKYSIDRSYLRTEFAQKSQWPWFIAKNVE